MNKRIKNYLFSSVLMMLAMGVTSCGDNEDTPEITDKGVVGSDAMISAACNSWKDARQDWEWSEAFLFGVAGDKAIDPHTDTWPFDKTKFNQYISKYNPAFNDDDAALIDDAIATGQNLTGFHAVEYLIFREGKARSISDVTANEMYFAQSASNDLYLNSLMLVAGWGGEISAEEQALLDDAEFECMDYGEDFINAGNPGSSYANITLATRQIISGAQDIIGEVRDSKIGAPATGEDINYIESPHAYNSIQDFYDNIMSCKHTLYGGWNITGTPTPTSLIGVCLGISQLKTAAEDVETKLDAALTAINNMKKPFVLYYNDNSAKNAMDALDELDSALAALDQLIEPYTGNTTLESKFKTVNEEFVTKTVRPTYRALADNNKKLVAALNQIKW